MQVPLQVPVAGAVAGAIAGAVVGVAAGVIADAGVSGEGTTGKAAERRDRAFSIFTSISTALPGATETRTQYPSTHTQNAPGILARAAACSISKQITRHGQGSTVGNFTQLSPTSTGSALPTISSNVMAATTLPSAPRPSTTK